MVESYIVLQLYVTAVELSKLGVGKQRISLLQMHILLSNREISICFCLIPKKVHPPCSFLFTEIGGGWESKNVSEFTFYSK